MRYEGADDEVEAVEAELKKAVSSIPAYVARGAVEAVSQLLLLPVCARAHARALAIRDLTGSVRVFVLSCLAFVRPRGF